MSSHTAAAAVRELFSDTELASYLGVKVSTLRKWRVTGHGVPWIKLGSLVRYRMTDVQIYLDSCPRRGAGNSTAQ